jgi:uncharacterized protein HemX
MQHEEHTRTDEVENLEGQQPQDPETVQATEPAAQDPNHHGPAGIIGILILVLVIALGGLYFWSAQTNAPTIDGELLAEDEADPVTEDLLMQGTTNEYESIRQDLETTDLGAIDADLDSFEAAMEAELSAEASANVAGN